jgi:dTDP-4-dehydrorhamnose 3,5-epimerase
MIFTETKLKGAFIIELEKFEDQRGFFARVWCQKELEVHGLNFAVAQINMSYNKNRGVIRGLHYQTAPFEEAKLIRCTRGVIYDVIIDLRPDSNTYLDWIGVELSADNRMMLYVPENFAHGYQSLTDNTEIFYPVSQFYSPESAWGVRWNDPAFGIDWPVTDNLVVSEQDQNWPDYLPAIKP